MNDVSPLGETKTTENISLISKTTDNGEFSSRELHNKDLSCFQRLALAVPELV